MKKKVDLRELIFMALCCSLGLFAKRLISPATNMVTDLIRLPGGGVAGGISMSFLLLGASMSRYRWAGSCMGLLQGLLALVFGLSGNQGIFSVITYTVPGVVIDAMRLLWRGEREQPIFFMITCCLANASTAFASNLLVFHFHGLTFFVWLALAMCAGLLGGSISGLLFKRLRLQTAAKDKKTI